MAYFRSWDPVDIRLLDFHPLLRAPEYAFETNVTVVGRNYQSLLEFIDPNGDPPLATGYYGSGFVLDAENLRLTAGTITAAYGWWFDQSLGEDGAWRYYQELRGFSIPAADLSAAMATTDRRDDAALIARIFSGADRIILSSSADYMDGFGGNDTISGGRGNDMLLGGSGRDNIYGGTGRDRLIGGTGNDQLNSTRDRASDTFVFNQSSGSDTVTGFEDRIDRIEITSGATSFRQVSVRDSGADALVRFGDSSILIKNIDHRLITEADFLFT